MPFLGNKPTNNFTSFEKQDITGSGTTSYTLAHAVNNEKDIDLYINHVHQEPTTAYSASGTALTLTESISSSDDCYVLFRSRAIQSATPPDGSVGTAKIADDAVTSAKLDTNIAVAGDLTVDTSTLKVDSSNNRVGIGTVSPTRQLTVQNTIANTGGVIGLTSSDSSTSGTCGIIHFGNSTDSSLASINGIADGATDAGAIVFKTEKTGAAIEERMRIASGGGLLLNGNYNFHALGGVAFPQTAFQFDFNKDTYAHPMKISCAITHWNSAYMSYTEGWYWGYNTAMSSGNVTSYTGTNGSWTISFPSNTVVRVRFNGDADYNHASGWYIKVEGNLRKTST